MGKRGMSMAKQILNEVFSSILQIVKQFPEGASLEGVLHLLTPPLPKRSLQRYLAFLTMEGQLTSLGKARARR